MILFVVWKNNPAFKLEIDGSNTVLELKTKIAKHFGETYTGFNILNGADIIDQSRNKDSVSSCGLNRVIRLPDNYNPGALKFLYKNNLDY